MRRTLPAAVAGLVLVVALAFSLEGRGQSLPSLDWPAPSMESRPWTRWWWMGSAVTREGITTELTALRDAGIGGVEITPVYGVRGYDDRFVSFLSPEWVDLLEHTLGEARRLGLGVDMATGTGWPFGGPWVGNDAAARNLEIRTYSLREGERLAEPVQVRQEPLLRAVREQVYAVAGTESQPGQPPAGSRSARRLRLEDLKDPIEANGNLQALAIEQVRFPRPLPLLALIAYSGAGDVVELTGRVGGDGRLDWIAPAGTWTLYAAFLGWHGKLVERAAPGGEGNVIDHFAAAPIRGYLSRFDRAFSGRPLEGLRAFFNDSYEVDDASGQADWTARLFDEFQARRGYDLRRYLPALRGDPGAKGESARVLADYRETISDLLLETFTTEWGAWARRRGAIVRNQAHGSPANILDLYAASDIPETEGTDIQRFKWASSAGHVAGRKLIAAEAATWLNEHFTTSLADVRRAVDDFFLGGVNHVVYHGTNYSPRDEAWPGWLFYAAVHFNSRNSWWSDFPALNTYITRVQSFLQAGRPDQDILLYYPEYDVLASRRGPALLEHFGGAESPTRGTRFDTIARTLEARGYTCDFVSDRLLDGVRADGGRLHAGGTSWRVVFVPQSRFVPLQTFERLLRLAADGATVLVDAALPPDVAGFPDLEERRRRYRELRERLSFGAPGGDGIREAVIGSGRFLMGNDVERLLARAGVRRETMTDGGLQFARRADERMRYYFVANRGTAARDGWVPLAVSARSAVLFDPMRGVMGAARVRTSEPDTVEVYLHLGPGESLIVAARPGESGEPPYREYAETGSPRPLAGSPWTLEFVAGGPTLPAGRMVDRLGSWTDLPGGDVKRFSGTAVYTTRFPKPPAEANAWRIDLGRVAESARVRLNGSELAVLIGPSYSVVLDDDLLRPSNQLSIAVSNLMANRIADLDRRGVGWKKFYNVNVAARLPENRGPDNLFTAAAWPPRESGLIGPVTLTPLR